jgi:hypothetical protein
LTNIPVPQQNGVNMADQPEHARLHAAATGLQQAAHQATVGVAITPDAARLLAAWLRDEARTWREHPSSDNTPSQHALTFADELLRG